MDVSEVRPVPRLLVHERAAPRRSGGTTDATATGPQSGTSPSNGVPPPVSDTVTVSDAARSEFQAWVARQTEQSTPGSVSGKQAGERIMPAQSRPNDVLPQPTPPGAGSAPATETTPLT